MDNERMNSEKLLNMNSSAWLANQNDISAISKQISEVFDIYDIPFLGCDFDRVYPDIAAILPKEAVSFLGLSLENSIACEVVCAAICHQMNWDYLRQAVLEKTKADTSWLCGERLVKISEDEVAALFVHYKKPERVRAKERSIILREVGKMACDAGGYQKLFLNEQDELLSIEAIQERLRKCMVFSKDPKEKKLQLLLQKLSVYEVLRGLSLHCKPAIDYHLIRCYLRRRLLYPKTKYAEEFIMATAIQRKENTMGALRQLCSTLIEQIAWYTELDVCVVNSIEWNIGRSVCTQNHPDCFLENDETAWLKAKYTRCPFFESCGARQDEAFLHINEPEYSGTSY